MKNSCLLRDRTRLRNPVGVPEGGIAVPLTLEQHERKLHDPALVRATAYPRLPGQHRRPHNGAFVAVTS